MTDADSDPHEPSAALPQSAPAVPKPTPVQAWGEEANAEKERRQEAGRVGFHAALAALLLILLSLALAAFWQQFGEIIERFWQN